MKTAIIGAGSIGTVMGAYLTRANYDVMLADTYDEHVKTLRERGATILHSDSAMDFTIPVSACHPDELTDEYDLYILLTKQTANVHVLPLLKERLRGGTVCTFQNGLPELSVSEAVGVERTIGGSVIYGASLLEPGVSRVTQDYDRFREYALHIGEIYKPRTERVIKIAEMLGAVGGVTITDNLMNTKWTKLLMNCTESGPSAAFNRTFGENADDPKSLMFSVFIAKECILVCEACGFEIGKSAGLNLRDYYWENKEQLKRGMEIFRENGKRSRNLIASMLFDLRHKRISEVEYINGMVAKMGRQHGIPTPFNSLIVDLVQEAEARSDLNDPLTALSRFDSLLSGYEDLLK